MGRAEEIYVHDHTVVAPSNLHPYRTMAVFNPRILDASLRDVANCLSDHQKADVLLYALENINPEG